MRDVVVAEQRSRVRAPHRSPSAARERRRAQVMRTQRLVDARTRARRRPPASMRTIALGEWRWYSSDDSGGEALLAHQLLERRRAVGAVPACAACAARRRRCGSTACQLPPRPVSARGAGRSCPCTRRSRSAAGRRRRRTNRASSRCRRRRGTSASTRRPASTARRRSMSARSGCPRSACSRPADGARPEQVAGVRRRAVHGHVRKLLSERPVHVAEVRWT